MAAAAMKMTLASSVGAYALHQLGSAAGKLYDDLPSLGIRIGRAPVERGFGDGVITGLKDAVQSVPVDWGTVAAVGAGAFACWAGTVLQGKISDYNRSRNAKWIPGGRVPETIVVGSEERTVMEPRCMARLAYKNSKGDYVMTGWCYRSDYNGEGYVITAQHCLDWSREMYLRKGDSFLPIDVTASIPLGNDGAIVPVPMKVLSQLGIQKARLGLLNESGQAVSVMGLSGKGTTGLLRPANRAGYFGWVIYQGTTLAGYSGSAYFSGNTVYGLHTCGGNFNGGLNAMYLHTKAKIATDDSTMEETPREIDEWFDDPDVDMDIEWDGDWAIVDNGRGKFIRLIKEQYYQAQARYEEKERASYAERVERELRYEDDMAREYNSGQVVVPQPPPIPQSVTVQIPVSNPPALEQAGNGPAPGTSRGGEELARRPQYAPETRPQPTPQSSQRSKQSVRQMIEEVRQSLALLNKPASTSSQLVQKPSTKPSASTRKTGQQQ